MTPRATAAPPGAEAPPSGVARMLPAGLMSKRFSHLFKGKGAYPPRCPPVSHCSCARFGHLPTDQSPFILNFSCRVHLPSLRAPSLHGALTSQVLCGSLSFFQIIVVITLHQHQGNESSTLLRGCWQSLVGVDCHDRVVLR